MILQRVRRAHISDWVGFCVYVSFAAFSLAQGAGVRLLLLPTIVFELIIAIAFLTREPARAKLQDLRPRAIAHAATFLMVVYFPLLRGTHPEWFVEATQPIALAMGVSLWCGGAIVAAWSVWHLRPSFSIEPQARRLITSGPYRFARHPVYAGYLLQYIGMWMIFPTLAFGGLLTAWWLLVKRRMRYEEQVLSNAFPEYADYRLRVGAVYPTFR